MALNNKTLTMKTHNYFITATLLFVCCTNAFCQWTYNKKVDEMTDDTSYYAYNKSLNHIGYYNGEIRGEITLEWKKGYDYTVVYLSLLPIISESSTLKEQILASDIPIHTDRVRFDKQPPFEWDEEEAIHHSESYFKNFIIKIKISEKMLWDLTLRDGWSEPLKFNVAGLKWKH
jgi:hypothetical protein